MTWMRACALLGQAIDVLVQGATGAMATRGEVLGDPAGLHRRLIEAATYIALLRPLVDEDSAIATEVDERVRALQKALAGPESLRDQAHELAHEICELQSIVCAVATRP